MQRESSCIPTVAAQYFHDLGDVRQCFQFLNGRDFILYLVNAINTRLVRDFYSVRNRSEVLFDLYYIYIHTSSFRISNGVMCSFVLKC